MATPSPEYRCDGCIWQDECPENELCDDYTPSGDDWHITPKQIEDGRIEFRREWFSLLDNLQ